MDRYKIKGGTLLNGTISISGSKNALLPILAASLICRDIVYLENVTPLEDTYSMIDILRHLNVRVFYDNKGKMIIDSRDVINRHISSDYTKKLRASYYFMGALLSLYKKISVGYPGGCEFSERPIDLHLMAFDKLGITSMRRIDNYRFVKNKEINEVIHFNKVSVGATINAILASVKIEGKIKLENVALEPEVDDLIDFLNKCGAKIKREKRNILIEGVKDLSGCKYKIMEDRIEAQTYLVLGALLGKSMKIMYSSKNHIKSFISLFDELKVPIQSIDGGFIVSALKDVKGKKLFFDIYPNLATDIQPILSILFSRASEESVFLDLVYPSRYSQINELVMMGYDMEIKDSKLIIRNNKSYLDSDVVSKDLRGGVSLVVAALLSDKTTIINDSGHIKRGYFDLVNKLKKLGAHIEKI